MEQTLALDLSHATEVGAIAAARAAGYGDKEGADDAAVEAIRNHLNGVDFSGRVVIGEGERDEAQVYPAWRGSCLCPGPCGPGRTRFRRPCQRDLLAGAVDPEPVPVGRHQGHRIVVAGDRTPRPL